MDDLTAQEFPARRRAANNHSLISFLVYGSAVLLGVVCTFLLGYFVLSITHQGTLELTIDPADARISIDGQDIPVPRTSADAPVQILLSTGSHRIRVARAGFIASSEMVTIERNNTHKMKISLRKEPAPMGSVELRIDQQGAQIYLDNKRVMVPVAGNLEPAIFQWPAGQYALRVVKAGFADHHEQLSVEKGKKTLVTVRFQR